MDSLLAVTEDNATLILITDAQIRDWHDNYKSWRSFITNLYNERLIELFSLVDAVAFQSVDQRLTNFLRTKKDSNSELNITHQEIANQIGTVREVVSRLLKQLENENKIKMFRGKIEVSDL
ncbi:MAG: helix-turn-helix domain-containing protein [Calditrichaeota bacterium]|nr:MAG: hypothetical protein DWQ03_12695 [Calditrichota bacterium]MBL1206101.1 helix-turn-helix domain-containing protein [Calditrichota bacterium]NOG45927.1 winged helix-turn-helix domain-containing protein [Calditrichota bacterium]